MQIGWQRSERKLFFQLGALEMWRSFIAPALRYDSAAAPALRAACVCSRSLGEARECVSVTRERSRMRTQPRQRVADCAMHRFIHSRTITDHRRTAEADDMKPVVAACAQSRVVAVVVHGVII